MVQVPTAGDLYRNVILPFTGELTVFRDSEVTGGNWPDVGADCARKPIKAQRRATGRA